MQIITKNFLETKHSCFSQASAMIAAPFFPFSPAQFPNGTQIGTTFNNTDYIQHTPGMWLTVTPPGSSQPFTGSFTGGSILPFILFKGQTYTTTGLGAIISKATDSGSFDELLAATILMAAGVVTVNRLLWRRMYNLAETRFRLET